MPPAPERPDGALYLHIRTGLALFVGRSPRTTPHHHYTASITVGIDAPLRVRPYGQAEWHETRCMIAAPDADHELDPQGGRVVNVQIDPEAPTFSQLEPLGLRQQPLQMLAPGPADSLVAALSPLLAPRAHLVQDVWSEIVNVLGLGPSAPRQFDPRIVQTLLHLKRTFPKAQPVAILAQQVGMSPGRLIRLFSYEVGVPLRRYLLWLRLRHVLFCVGAGCNLTDAAHDAGFSDSAHLTRVFREMFGVTPSSLLRSPEVTVRVIVPSDLPDGPHATEDAARMLTLKRGVIDTGDDAESC